MEKDLHCVLNSLSTVYGINTDTNIIAGWKSLFTHHRCHHCIRSDVRSASR